MRDGLRLEVTEYTDLTRWRWVLTDDGDAFLADHEVRLDPSDWEYEAATDLPLYISWHASPDERYTADETRIVHETGAWLGQNVFGPSITEALLQQRRPVTVQVTIPLGAEDIAFLPLEIAHADGRSLAQQDVSLVMHTGSPGTVATTPVSRDRLRVLGLFSLPEGGTPLNLRRERHALVQLIDGLAADGRAAEIRVLQYGVTRDRLRDILLDAGGWDVIHISGHGAPGELLLETAEGQPDPIGTGDLIALLDLAREHIQLVTLSACWSAALGAAEQRRLLRLPVPGGRERTAETTASAPASALGSLAAELARRLGCAILAMRYPVDDEFAITLSASLYDLLARHGQPLPRAVALTLKQLADGNGQERGFPALSLASPAIFGDRAAGLRLRAPERAGPLSFSTDALKMPGFPPQPGRFVGRTAVMARASAALAPGSGTPGVVLYGMPGGGKTACARELAYTHEHAFTRLIWFKAPDEGMDIQGSLTNFAVTLENRLDDFQMTDVLADAQKLTAFLPRLTETMKRNRVLIVLDNAESLLTDDGRWRDQQWGQVITALTAHTGLGRFLLTIRRVPRETPAPGDGSPHTPVRPESTALTLEPVDALSPDESLLLARELPHLNRLIRGELNGLDRDISRRLALGVLNIAQGHPKLLELADGQAAHPDRLTALIEAGDQAWRDQGGLPNGFFTTGTTAAEPADYLHVLATWTKTVSDTLSPGERDLFWFLCCLEEPDREQLLLEIVWPRLWQRLDRAWKPPELDQALVSVASLGLIVFRPETATEDESYALHPGVAAAGRDRAGPAFQHATDTEVAVYWDAVHDDASGKNGDGTVHTELLVRAGLAAVPYLVRQEQWASAAVLLHNAFISAPSRANAAAVLPAIKQIARREPRYAITLACVLLVLDPKAGENQLRTALADAAACGDHEAASIATGILVDLCRESGRLAEALALAEQKAERTRQAGLGPWSQLADEVWRLQVLNAMGQASLVLDEVQRLREHMATLPADPGPNETAIPWNAREALLDTGRYAALQLGQWQEALDLSAAIAASQRDRRAPAANTARSRFNDYFPLLQLGRTNEALHLLQDCCQVFQDAHDIKMLGNTLIAIAAAEDQRDHGDAAISLERDALRYSYLAGDVTSIAVSHHNLGNYLRRHARQPIPALASHLTAALIRTLANAADADQSLNAATADLLEFGDAAEPPTDVADLCRKLGDLPGTDPAGLIAQLAPDAETAERILRDLIAQARSQAEPDQEGS